MNWSNLKNSKCPKCGHYLTDKGLRVCCEYCDFRIRPERLKEIINESDRKTRPYQPMSEEESFEALNNLGMDEVAEDFSDSPWLE